MAAAIDAHGRLDVMVNNAGTVGVIGRITETPTDAWDHTVAVLMRSVFLGMKHAAGAMVPQRSGVIISIASTAGILGGLGPHCYTACKDAVIGLTKSVASELAGSGIRVNAIAPGSTVSAMTSAVLTDHHTDTDAAATTIAARSALGIASWPEHLANAAVYLASAEARIVTGHTLVIDAGQTAFGGDSRFHRQPAAFIHEPGRRT